MTSRVKDYTDKKITHSVLSITNCYIIYHARRYECPHCKKTFYENNPFTFETSVCSYCIQCSQRISRLQMQALLMSLEDMAYPLHLLLIFSDKHVHISRRQLPECLALDEVYAFKSHDSDYVCVIMDYLDKKIVDVLPSRRKYNLLNSFMIIVTEEAQESKICLI